MNRGALSKSLFRRKDRIKKRSEISQLFKNGQRWDCISYNIIFKNNDLGYDRIAIILTRKIGNAVVRNRIKRIFREIFRKRKEKKPPFYDVLIQPRPGFKAKENEKIEKCLEIWFKSSKK